MTDKKLERLVAAMRVAQAAVVKRTAELFPPGVGVRYRHGTGYARGVVQECSYAMPCEVLVRNVRTGRNKWIHLETHQPEVVNRG